MRTRVQLLILAAVGGGLGALARWSVGTAVSTGASAGVSPGAPAWVPTGIPAGTLLVNLTGCLILGLLVGARPLSPRLLTLVGTGFCGGFTTFSALAVEADAVLAQQPELAAGYLIASLMGGTALAAVGLSVGRRSSARTPRRRTSHRGIGGTSRTPGRG